jgi:hypothetical protein
MKENIGKIATELIAKSDDKHSAIDQTSESLTDYERNVIECAEKGLKEHKSDFFIVVITKKEALFDNIYRNYFLHRRSCPTPEYDQTVYHYIYKQDALKYMWTIPDKDTCQMYRMYVAVVKEEEKQLLGFVLGFYDGSLDRLAAKLNKESVKEGFLQNAEAIVPKEANYV